MRRLAIRRPTDPRSALLTAVLAMALVAMVVTEVPEWEDTGPANAFALLGYVLAVALADQMRLEMPGRAASTSPMAIAVVLAMAMTTELTGERPVTYGAGLCVAVGAVALAIGAGVRWRSTAPSARREMVEAALACVASLVVASLLMRGIHVSGDLVLADIVRTRSGWTAALVMLAVGAAAIVAESPLRALRRAARERTSWRRAFQAELESRIGLGAAITVTGTLIAVCMPVLGVISVPLMMLPLGLTQLAVRRHTAIRTTYRQTVEALSRMPEVVGVVPPGHAVRVAQICSDVGRILLLPEREVSELEYAALLHDIGQTWLRRPLPDGAATLAAPADQQKIADDGAQIVRETGVLDSVADILQRQTTRYHVVVERGDYLPMASRIIKVVNAYADFLVTGDGRTERERHQAAIERIYLGLGYEYDPRVVAALEVALARRV